MAKRAPPTWRLRKRASVTRKGVWVNLRVSSRRYISSSFSFEASPRSVLLFSLSFSLSFCFSHILVPAVPGELPSRQIPDSTCAACDILPGAAMLIRLVLLVLSLVSWDPLEFVHPRFSLSLFFFDSPRHFSFHRIVQLVLFHYYVAQILWSQLWYNTATIGWKLLIWPVQKLPIIIVKFERYIRLLSIRILDKFLSFSSYAFLSFFWLRSISTRVSSNAFPAHFHFDYSCQVLSVGRLRPARN